MIIKITITNRKFLLVPYLAQTESVPQMQPAIHVRKGEGDHVLGAGIGLGRCVLLEDALLVPSLLNLALDIFEKFHLKGALPLASSHF